MLLVHCLLLFTSCVGVLCLVFCFANQYLSFGFISLRKREGETGCVSFTLIMCLPSCGY